MLEVGVLYKVQNLSGMSEVCVLYKVKLPGMSEVGVLYKVQLSSMLEVVLHVYMTLKNLPIYRTRSYTTISIIGVQVDDI